MSRFLSAAVFVLMLFASAPGYTQKTEGRAQWEITKTSWFPGVNLSGAEFNSERSKLWTDYAYPNAREIDYYTAKGFKLFRIPFLAKRVIQPNPGVGDGGTLTREMDLLVGIVRQAARKGAWVVLDMHDYGYIFTKGMVGRDPGAVEEFAAAWRLIADRVKQEPNVIFGLMNEPNKQTAAEWLSGANAAIAAIRGAGAIQPILVPGSYWDGAHSWMSSDNGKVMLGVVDPADNYVFEVHQYLDGNSSGTHREVVAGAGSMRLAAFTNWARKNQKRAVLGEFGWADNPAAHKEGDALVAYMAANKDVWLGWTYWAGGPWWGEYMFSIEPNNGIDRPQMDILSKYLH